MSRYVLPSFSELPLYVALARAPHHFLTAMRMQMGKMSPRTAPRLVLIVLAWMPVCITSPTNQQASQAALGTATRRASGKNEKNFFQSSLDG